MASLSPRRGLRRSCSSTEHNLLVLTASHGPHGSVLAWAVASRMVSDLVRFRYLVGARLECHAARYTLGFR